MHIILGVLSAVGFLAYLIYRANQAAEAGRFLGDAASDAKGLIRRASWRRKAKVDLVRSIEDPRLAASLMLYVIAKCEGDVTEGEKDVILGQMREVLELSQPEAREMLAQVRWLTADMKDVSAFLRRASRAILDNCDGREKGQLIGMLRSVAETNGGASALQDDAVDRLAHDLGVPRA